MKKSVRVSLAMCLSIAIGLSILLICLCPYIFLLFTSDTAVLQGGIFMVHFMMPAYFIYVFTEILSGAIRGTGDAFIPMLITCVGVCVLRIAWIALIVPRWHDTRGVMLSFPISWVVSAAIFIIYYLRGNWMQRGIKKLDESGVL